jgi:hypothetical protein
VKIIGPSSPDEVFAIFLLADLDSKEEKAQILRDVLSTLGVGEEVLNPALDDVADSVRARALRKRILMRCHGGTLGGLILDEIEWYWAELQDHDPLLLMNTWEFKAWTNGTLLPQHAIDGFAKNRPLDSMTERIKNGESLPPCICLATDKSGPAVLLDGNGRAIALASVGRRPERILFGLSPGVTSWNFCPPPAVLS